MERPILFSAPMVLAILAGRKTQTRRLIKPQPTGPHQPLVSFNHGRMEFAFGPENRDPSGVGPRWWRPKAQPGDTLWVRENFTIVPASAYRQSTGVAQTVNPDDRDEAAIYAAGWERSIPKWRPSIHMPRWASRITLDVVDVRAERLHECTEADAIAEGSQEPTLVPTIGACWSEREAYAKLWEVINGAGSWAANPLVWVYTFAVSGERQADG